MNLHLLRRFSRPVAMRAKPARTLMEPWKDGIRRWTQEGLVFDVGGVMERRLILIWSVEKNRLFREVIKGGDKI